MNFIDRLKEFYTINLDSEYKKFAEEAKTTPSEYFYRDGERDFTQKEKYYLDVLDRQEIKQIKKISVDHSKKEPKNDIPQNKSVDQEINQEPEPEYKTTNVLTERQGTHDGIETDKIVHLHTIDLGNPMYAGQEDHVLIGINKSDNTLVQGFSYEPNDFEEKIIWRPADNSIKNMVENNELRWPLTDLTTQDRGEITDRIHISRDAKYNLYETNDFRSGNRGFDDGAMEPISSANLHRLKDEDKSIDFSKYPKYFKTGDKEVDTNVSPKVNLTPKKNNTDNSITF